MQIGEKEDEYEVQQPEQLPFEQPDEVPVTPQEVPDEEPAHVNR